MIQKRNIAICIILSIVTFSIYQIYWFICLTNDANTAANSDDTSGGTAFLLTLVTCSIYGFYWTYKQGEKIDIARQKHGMPAGNNGALYLILYAFGLGIVAQALMQNELNTLASINN